MAPTLLVASPLVVRLGADLSGPARRWSYRGMTTTQAERRYGGPVSREVRQLVGQARARVAAARAAGTWPGWPEAVTATLLVYLSAWNGPGTGSEPATRLDAATSSAVFVCLALACALAVLVRRRAPATSVCVLGVVCTLHVLVWGTLTLLVVAAALLAAQTATSRVARPWSWLLLAAGYLGAGAGILRVGYQGGGQELEGVRAATVLTISWSFLTVAALTGLLRRRARERREQAAERMGLLLAQRDAEQALVVARERQRIARDVHDVVGHSLAVIGMQAEGARAVMPVSPERAEEALAVIARTSRRAIDEVHALVDVLRHADDSPASPAREQHPAPETRGVPTAHTRVLAAPAQEPPGLEGLAALVTRLRESGLQVCLDLHDALPSPCPVRVAQCVYRLVQEATTNALRHAPGAGVQVCVRAVGGQVRARVRNDAAPGSSLPPDRQHDVRRQGAGLESMAGRVAELGGSLHAGPRAGGGWGVEAVIPLTTPLTVTEEE